MNVIISDQKFNSLNAIYYLFCSGLRAWPMIPLVAHSLISLKNSALKSFEAIIIKYGHLHLII